MQRINLMLRAFVRWQSVLSLLNSLRVEDPLHNTGLGSSLKENVLKKADTFCRFPLGPLIHHWALNRIPHCFQQEFLCTCAMLYLYTWYNVHALTAVKVYDLSLVFHICYHSLNCIPVQLAEDTSCAFRYVINIISAERKAIIIIRHRTLLGAKGWNLSHGMHGPLNTCLSQASQTYPGLTNYLLQVHYKRYAGLTFFLQAIGLFQSMAQLATGQQLEMSPQQSYYGQATRVCPPQAWGELVLPASGMRLTNSSLMLTWSSAAPSPSHDKEIYFKSKRWVFLPPLLMAQGRVPNDFCSN